MVKINICIEGEDIEQIVEELFSLGLNILKSNQKNIREAMRLLADNAIEILSEKKTLEKGAQLYKKINMEINWTYKRDHEN
ncbi:MAG: hypothetical protein QXL17_02415 [Candidatus Thermoplasmatota archaeon]